MTPPSGADVASNTAEIKPPAPTISISVAKDDARLRPAAVQQPQLFLICWRTGSE